MEDLEGDEQENMTDHNEETADSNSVQNSSREFDINMPTTHGYLGKLENISGYTIYEDGQIIELPAVYTNTLAFPGFTLPLVLNENENSFPTGYNFVLIWLIKDKKMFFEYGVVMEVFECSNTGRQINIKARGRQRCFILPQQIHMNSHLQMCKAKVKIIEEAPITSPLSCTQLSTLKQPFHYDPDNARIKRYRKWHLTQFTFPHWVYDLYEVDYYVKRIVKSLCRYYSEENIPKDPTSLSFWFGQNFQLMNSERLAILQSNTTLERLQQALKYLNIERNICCFHCGTFISHQKDVFAMSKHGLQSNYVNPGGVVYETVTVKKIINFNLEGSPSTQFTWFPGYAWTIIKCADCGGHLGWKFSASNLSPGTFYGLARSCLSITTNQEPECNNV